MPDDHIKNPHIRKRINLMVEYAKMSLPNKLRYCEIPQHQRLLDVVSVIPHGYPVPRVEMLRNGDGVLLPMNLTWNTRTGYVNIEFNYRDIHVFSRTPDGAEFHHYCTSLTEEFFTNLLHTVLRGEIYE